MVDRVGEGGDAGEDSPLSRGGDQAPLPRHCSIRARRGLYRPLRCPTAAALSAALPLPSPPPPSEPPSPPPPSPPPSPPPPLSATFAAATLSALGLRFLGRFHAVGAAEGSLYVGGGVPLLPPTGVGWGAGDARWAPVWSPARAHECLAKYLENTRDTISIVTIVCVQCWYCNTYNHRVFVCTTVPFSHSMLRCAHVCREKREKKGRKRKCGGPSRQGEHNIT